MSNDQIFNYVANANNPLNVYLNGTKVPDGTNYRDIKLNAHDEIAIVFGTPPSTIPSSYKFLQGIFSVKITCAEPCSTKYIRIILFGAYC